MKRDQRNILGSAVITSVTRSNWRDWRDSTAGNALAFMLVVKIGFLAPYTVFQFLRARRKLEYHSCGSRTKKTNKKKKTNKPTQELFCHCTRSRNNRANGFGDSRNVFIKSGSGGYISAHMMVPRYQMS